MKYITFLLLCFSMAGIVLAQDEPLEYKPTAGTVILEGMVLSGTDFQMRIEGTQLLAQDIVIWDTPLEPRGGMDTTSVTVRNWTKFAADAYWQAKNSGADPNTALQDFANQHDFIDRIEPSSPNSYNVYYEDGSREIWMIGKPGPDNTIPTLERVHAQYDFFATGIIAKLNKGCVVIIGDPRREHCQPVVTVFQPGQHDDVLHEVIDVLQGRVNNLEFLDEKTAEEIKGNK